MFMSFSVHVSISDFLLFVKKGFVVGVHSLKVTARHSNNAGSSYEYPHCLGAMHRLALDNRPTQFNSPNTHTHTRCTLSCTTAGRQGGREAGKKRGRMEGGGMGGQGSEGNFKGGILRRELASIQYSQTIPQHGPCP